MDKEIVKDIVNDEIKKFVNNSLDGEIKKIIGKSNTQTRSEMVSIIKNALESVYKMLWQKKDFWKADIR